jgi:hypothetical protein
MRSTPSSSKAELVFVHKLRSLPGLQFRNTSFGDYWSWSAWLRRAQSHGDGERIAVVVEMDRDIVCGEILAVQVAALQ